MRPDVEHLVIAFAFGDDAALIELVALDDFLLGLADDARLSGGRDQVVGAERQTAAGAFAEADHVQIVEQIDGCAAAEELVAIGNHFGQVAGAHADGYRTCIP